MAPSGPCCWVSHDTIDEHCLVFDLEEENKFEYTLRGFMDLVDKLLCELLEDLGVQPEKLVAVLSIDMSQSQISSLVLTSILSVEDFLQFKAMMVKRNVELTNQVIESLIEKKEQEAAGAGEEEERKDREETEQILAENGEVDERPPNSQTLEAAVRARGQREESPRECRLQRRERQR